jgi:DNA-binding FadR family transcriptional regulator
VTSHTSGSERHTEPVRIPKAAALVASRLRTRIVVGELAQGDALPNETELMRYYMVSRPTVREALRILETESLVSVKRGAGGGARVTAPNPAVTARHAALLLRTEGTTLEDLFVARSIVEPAAAALLARRRDPNVVAALRGLHADSIDVVDDPVAYPVVAARFHEQVIALSGNRTLSLFARLVTEIVQAHNQATFARLEHPLDVAVHATHDHAELIDLVEKGDATGAEACWRRHMDGAADMALVVLGSATTVPLLEPPL